MAQRKEPEDYFMMQPQPVPFCSATLWNREALEEEPYGFDFSPFVQYVTQCLTHCQCFPFLVSYHDKDKNKQTNNPTCVSFC